MIATIEIRIAVDRNEEWPPLRDVLLSSMIADDYVPVTVAGIPMRGSITDSTESTGAGRECSYRLMLLP